LLHNAGWPKSRPAFFLFQGAQAASLFISAACRDASFTAIADATDVAGKLPATAGWQPALPVAIRHPPSTILVFTAGA
jgi:hypothetical protein